MTPVTAAGPTPAAMLADLVAVSRELVDVLDQESARLEAMDTDAIADLAPRKAVLSENYERLLNGLRSAGQALVALPRTVRDGAKVAADRLNRAAKRNELALKAVAKANERMLRTVVRALEDQTPRTTGYDALGNTPRTAGPEPMSVRFNTTL